MKTARVAIALAAETALFCWCGAAQAYRHFDGKDAAVAETGEVEIELGPVEYLRDEADRALLASNVRIKYGFTPGWEAVLEGSTRARPYHRYRRDKNDRKRRLSESGAARGQPAREIWAQHRNRVR